MDLTSFPVLELKIKKESYFKAEIASSTMQQLDPVRAMGTHTMGSQCGSSRSVA